MKLYDISRPLTAATPTWPGDTAYRYTVNWPKAESGSVNVGKLVMSIHTGTHVDAPFHFDDAGKKTLELPLDLYVGAARVVDVSGRASIGADDLAGVDLSGVTRLLLKTLSWSDPEQFPAEICYLRPDLPPYLAERGIRLLGVDVPSVDQGAARSSRLAPAWHLYFGRTFAGRDRAWRLRTDCPAARPGRCRWQPGPRHPPPLKRRQTKNRLYREAACTVLLCLYLNLRPT